MRKKHVDQSSVTKMGIFVPVGDEVLIVSIFTSHPQIVGVEHKG